jgi:superfamily I DNA/RNA helicase
MPEKRQNFSGNRLKSIQKLRKEAPDLYSKVLGERMSLEDALSLLESRKWTMTVSLDPDELVKTLKGNFSLEIITQALRRHFTPEERLAMARFLTGEEKISAFQSPQSKHEVVKKTTPGSPLSAIGNSDAKLVVQQAIPDISATSAKKDLPVDKPPVCIQEAAVAEYEVANPAELLSSPNDAVSSADIPSKVYTIPDLQCVYTIPDLQCFKINPQHLAILSSVLNGSGDLVIEAVAGAGKTSTLRWLTQYIPHEVLIAAFSRSFKDELDRKDKRPRTEIRTTYSLGLELVREVVEKDERKIKVEKKKYDHLIDELCFPYHDKAFDMSDALTQLVKFVRLSLTDPNDEQAISELAEHYQLDTCQYDPRLKEFLFGSIPRVLEWGEKVAKNGVEIQAKEGPSELVYMVDFVDMIWLPHVWQLTPRKKLKWIMVDECQDLSRAQLELILKFRSSDCKMIFVGDRHQAIYGFSGADAESFQNTIERTKAQVFPLSFTRRCPKRVVTLAQEIVPEIEALSEAPDGQVKESNQAQMLKEAVPGDMILSRKKAPLVRLCITFIKKRKPATIIGRDISSQLTTIVQAVAKARGFAWPKFLDALDDYIDNKLGRLRKKEAEEDVLEEWKDRKEAIEACYEEWHVQNVEDFCNKIRNLFSDEDEQEAPANRIRLSTVHKAKGLEANRVFIINPQELPLYWRGQKSWQKEQEMNLKYVALTRARETLFFVR